VGLLLIAASQMLCGTSLVAGRERTADQAHVRPTVTRLREALDRGVALSPTLRDLVDRLEDSDVIVHLTLERYQSESDLGMLRFAASANGVRYVRISIRHDLRLDDLAVVIGHELQHAVEIADRPWVDSEKALDQLYRTIGFETTPGQHETMAAQDVARRVHQEIGK
jgi:hypothetical protein